MAVAYLRGGGGIAEGGNMFTLKLTLRLRPVKAKVVLNLKANVIGRERHKTNSATVDTSRNSRQSYNSAT